MTPNQTKALAALLTCKSRTDAARVCGLSTKTLQNDADFRGKCPFYRQFLYQRCKRNMYSAANG